MCTLEGRPIRHRPKLTQKKGPAFQLVFARETGHGNAGCVAGVPVRRREARHFGVVWRAKQLAGGGPE